jgi:UDP-N-acetylglucosamine 2-epimerase
MAHATRDLGREPYCGPRAEKAGPGSAPRRAYVPKAISFGVARLVGHDPGLIVSKTSRLHADPDAYRLMAKGVSPDGDGKASARIALAVWRFFSVEPLKAAG